MQNSESNTITGNESIDYSIIRESDYYNELKQASETGQQSTFALILSMLTTDANELDQFHQPITAPIKDSSDLYKKYFVQPSQIRADLSGERSLALNEMIQQKHLQSVQLDLGLKPEPLLNTEQLLIDSNVFNNLDVNVRAKVFNDLQQHNTDVEDDKTETKNVSNDVDINAWFNVLEEARTLSMTA